MVKVASVVGHECCTGDQRLRGDEDVIGPRAQTFTRQKTRNFATCARLFYTEGQDRDGPQGR